MTILTNRADEGDDDGDDGDVPGMYQQKMADGPFPLDC